MDQNDSLVARFEEHRPHLKSVAYRMLGSLAEADDAVQEAWLRVTRADTAAVDNLGGWLTTVVARICLNVLRSRHREVPLDVHVPDPVLARLDGGAPDPEQEALLADSVGLALLRRAGDAEPGGAARLRAARHVLDAVRRDRPRPGPE